MNRDERIEKVEEAMFLASRSLTRDHRYYAAIAVDRLTPELEQLEEECRERLRAVETWRGLAQVDRLRLEEFEKRWRLAEAVVEAAIEEHAARGTIHLEWCKFCTARAAYDAKGRA